ncbi:uncharacterized protein LOC135389248 [Ornithodoros turicata]|uniref:uncharacterized protein LOC135389248 n=1 Tax=Ornithodoros turicata TaxID=34597 RepID=UPI003138B7CC
MPRLSSSAKIKADLAAQMLLYHLKHGAPTILTVDASNAFDRTWHPIAFFSTALKPAETKTATTGQIVLLLSSSTEGKLLNHLHRSFESLRPVPTRATSSRKPDLSTATHVFLRTDSVKKALCPPYSGPHPVLQQSDKTFRVVINDKEDTVSADRLNPAFIENPFIERYIDTELHNVGSPSIVTLPPNQAPAA